jgi:hypothetical protein
MAFVVAASTMGCYMTGHHAEVGDLAGFLGTYEERRDQPQVNGRPTFVLATRRTTTMWFSGRSWMVGRDRDIGTSVGALHVDDTALAPNLVSRLWSGWSTRNASWKALQSVRCISGDAAAAAIETERVALEQSRQRAATTVYFVSSKLDRLRREWVGAYKRQRECVTACLNDGRYMYRKDGSTTKMM